MEVSKCKVIIFGIILALFTVSADSVASVGYSCCDFSSTYYCDWEWVPTSWHQYPPNAPDLSDPTYTNFVPNDGYYTWLQDQSGTMLSDYLFGISSASTVITFDYYFNTPGPLPNDYLHVVFSAPNGGINGIVIASITTPFDGWRSFAVTCDASVNFCCGSMADIPCTGTIEIAASLDVTVNVGLFGFDNICSDGQVTTTPYVPTTTPYVPTTTPYVPTTTPYVPTTTTAPPITLPPPHPSPSGCCEFDYDVCDFYQIVPYWYWSVDVPNSYVPTSFDGTRSFLWSQTSGSTIGNALIPYVDYTTFFSLSYFISSSSSTLVILFAQSGYAPRVVSSLYYTGGAWSSLAIQASSLCMGASSCTGSIEVEVSGNGLVAIDDADVNGACGGFLPCCDFDDPYFCHLHPTDPTNPWLWSGYKTPNYPYVYPPTPNSQYIYFETPATYSGPIIDSALVSDVITIADSTTFRGNFFVYTPLGESGFDALQLNFREISTGVLTDMQFAKTTSNTWFVAEFACFSLHGDCCQGQPICSGTLEINAHVESSGAEVFYGIDAFDINDLCPSFPTLTMISGSEEKVIPLKPRKMH